MPSDKQKIQKDIQEAQEQFHFELFKELYTLWPDGGLEDKDREERIPDFLFRYPDNVLGIEHSELFKAKGINQAVSPQEQEGSLQKIVGKARNICANGGIPPLEVKVFFTPAFEDTRITDKQSQQLSQRLAQFVEELSKTVSSLPPFVEPGDELPEISYILIKFGIRNGHRWLDYHRWSKTGGCQTQAEFIVELQQRINSKNKKYREYIKKCDECWLLIVADRRNPAQAFDIDFSDKVTSHVYQSKFTRTFYMEVTHKRLVKLTTTR